MKIYGARNRPRMMISGARNLQSHNEVFWAQKLSFFDDFWAENKDFWAQNVCRVIMTFSGARNHHSVMISGPRNVPLGRFMGPEKCKMNLLIELF